MAPTVSKQTVSLKNREKKSPVPSGSQKKSAPEAARVGFQTFQSGGFREAAWRDWFTLTRPLKRDQFNKKLHLPTIIFGGHVVDSEFPKVQKFKKKKNKEKMHRCCSLCPRLFVRQTQAGEKEKFFVAFMKYFWQMSV